MAQDIYRPLWGVDGDFIDIPDLGEFGAISIGSRSEVDAVEVYPRKRANQPLIASCRSPLRGPIRGPLLIKPLDPIDADAGASAAELLALRMSVHLLVHDLGDEAAPIKRADARYTQRIAAVADWDNQTDYLVVPFRGRASFSLATYVNADDCDIKIIAASSHGVQATADPEMVFSGDTLATETSIAAGDGKLYQWGGKADWIVVYSQYSSGGSAATIVNTVTVED